MKKVLFLIALIVIVISTKASHIVGGEISYKYVGSDSIDITVKIYRDCNGVTLSNFPAVIKNGCVSYTVPITPVSVTDVTGVGDKCGGSRCSGPYPYGIQLHIFTARVAVPLDTCTVGGSPTGCEVIISWTGNARTSNISTTDAADKNFYIETRFNHCLASANSSPEFVNVPQILLNVGRLYYITNAAIDPDGDFLTYEPVVPLIDSVTPASYLGLWSPQKPLSYTGFPANGLALPTGFHFDSLTGNMAFRHAKVDEVSIIATKVKEWRVINGVLTKIGEVRREAQVIAVKSTGNQVPRFENFEPKVPICDSSAGNYCFNVAITDLDITDTVAWEYKTNIPGASFTDIGTAPNNPVIQVCFTVDSLMLKSIGKYQFTIFTNDNGCNISGKSAKTFYLVTDSPSIAPDSFGIRKDLLCNNYKISIENYSHKPTPPHTWTIKNNHTIIHTVNDTLQGAFSDTGWYYITLDIGITSGCRSYYDSIYIPEKQLFSVYLGADDTLHCWADTVTFMPQITNGIAPFRYSWMNGDTAAFTRWSFDTSGIDTITVKITDSINCTAVGSVIYKTYKPLVTASNYTRICIGDTAKITAQLLNVDTTNATYSWTGFTAQQLEIMVSPDTSAKYEFNYEDSLGCPAFTHTYVYVSNPEINISTNALDTNYRKVCLGDTVILTAVLQNTDTAKAIYGWAGYTPQQKELTLLPLVSGMYEFNYKDSLGCAASASSYIEISNPQVSLEYSDGPATAYRKVCTGDTLTLTAILQNADTAKATYGWTGGPSQTVTTQVLSVNSQVYAFNYTDSVGCTATASTYIEIANPRINLVYADTVCRGDTITMAGIATSRGYQWPVLWDSVFTGNIYKIPSGGLPYGTHQVQVTYSDSGQCPKIEYIDILIDSMPRIAFIIPREVCENTPAFTLLVSPSGGTWMGSGIAGNNFTPASASPGWHQLVYEYVGSTPTCSAIDTFDIRVLQQPIAGFIVDKYISILNDTFRFTNATTADTTFESDWDFGDFSSSIQRNPKQVYADTGVYFVTLWVDNGVCAPDSATTTVKVGSHYLSVSEIKGGGNLKLYPNPATSDITVEAESTITEITLTDITGRRTVFEEINTNKAVINISGLTTGIYMVHVKDVNNAVYTAKVVVQR